MSVHTQYRAIDNLSILKVSLKACMYRLIIQLHFIEFKELPKRVQRSPDIYSRGPVTQVFSQRASDELNWKKKLRVLIKTFCCVVSRRTFTWVCILTDSPYGLVKIRQNSLKHSAILHNKTSNKIYGQKNCLPIIEDK